MMRRGRRRGEPARAALESLRAVVFVAAVLGSAAASGCNSVGPGAEHVRSDHPLLGVAAPALEVPTADGKGRITLAEYAGKIVVVDFWATWCEPCRKSFPAYQKLTEEFGGKVVVLGVSVDESPDDIPAFAKATGVQFPIGWDEGQTAARSFEPTKMPTSFLVDASGIIRFVHAGYSPGDEHRLRAELKSMM